MNHNQATIHPAPSFMLANHVALTQHRMWEWGVGVGEWGGIKHNEPWRQSVNDEAPTTHADGLKRCFHSLQIKYRINCDRGELGFCEFAETSSQSFCSFHRKEGINM